MRALAAVLVSTLALLGVMMLAQSLSAPAPASSNPATGPVAAVAGQPQPPVELERRPHVWPAPDPRDVRDPSAERSSRSDARRPGSPGDDRLTAMVNGVDDWVTRTRVGISRDEDLRKKQAARMFDAGLFAPSADAYRAATELNPADAEAWSGLGRALSADGRFEEAADAYERAVALRPTDSGTQFNLGVTYVRLDRTGDAIESFRRAVIADPAHEKSFFNLATLTEMDGRLAEARYWWEQLAALGGPSATTAMASAGRVALRQGATTDALESLAVAFLARPADPEIVRPLAVAADAESFENEHLRAAAIAWRNWLMVIDPSGQMVEPATGGPDEFEAGKESVGP